MQKTSISIFFVLHDPWHLSKHNHIHIGKLPDIFKGFGKYENKTAFENLEEKCISPFLKAIETYDIDFSMYISGTFIEKCKKYAPKSLKKLETLIQTKNIELLSGTYHNSLASKYSLDEFIDQIKLHRSITWKYFKKKPTAFYNSDFIIDSQILEYIRLLGFHTIVGNEIKKLSPNYPYSCPEFKLPSEDIQNITNKKIMSATHPKIALLLRNNRLTSDIEERFYDKSWDQYPLTPDTFLGWIQKSPGNTVNLFFNIKYFGFYNSKKSQVLKFMSKFIEKCKDEDLTFQNISSTSKSIPAKKDLKNIDINGFKGGESDYNLWTENSMQQSLLELIYNAEDKVKKSKNEKLLDIWRRLQSSENLYYTNTTDHKQIETPYESPYNAYINFMSCFQEFNISLDKA